MTYSWSWRGWFLNIKQHKSCLPSRALSHGALSSISLKSPKLGSCFLPFVLLSGSWTLHCHGHCRPRLPSTITSSKNPSLLGNMVSVRVPLLVISSVAFIRKNISLIACTLLRCFFGSYSISSTGPQPANTRLLQDGCRRPYPSVLPRQVAYSRQPLQCHPY